jgi:hypothetical protein
MVHVHPVYCGVHSESSVVLSAVCVGVYRAVNCGAPDAGCQVLWAAQTSDTVWHALRCANAGPRDGLWAMGFPD